MFPPSFYNVGSKGFKRPPNLFLAPNLFFALCDSIFFETRRPSLFILSIVIPCNKYFNTKPKMRKSQPKTPRFWERKYFLSQEENTYKKSICGPVSLSYARSSWSRQCTGGDVHRNYSTLPLSPGVLNERAGCSVCFGIVWFCGGKSYFCICFCCIIVWDFFGT